MLTYMLCGSIILMIVTAIVISHEVNYVKGGWTCKNCGTMNNKEVITCIYCCANK